MFRVSIPVAQLRKQNSSSNNHQRNIANQLLQSSQAKNPMYCIPTGKLARKRDKIVIDSSMVREHIFTLNELKSPGADGLHPRTQTHLQKEEKKRIQ